MGFFRKQKNAGAPIITDPFAVIPVKPEDVEMRKDSRGHIHLRRRPQLKGVQRFLAEALNYDYSKTVELDEHGSLYFSLADGNHDLKTIVDRMMAASNKSRKDVEEGVIIFTKKLMTMNMILLKVPESAQLKKPL